MQQQPAAAAAPPPRQMPANITTEQIQKYLDENKQLILAILENQNLGKLSECAAYQAQLQKNLLFLAAIADSQPQISPPSQSQMMPNSATPPQGGFFAQQAPMFPPRSPLNFNLQAIQEQHQQLHQMPPQMAHFHGYMGARPGMMNRMHAGQPQAASQDGGGEPMPAPSLPEFGRDGNKALSSSSADNRGNRHDAGTPTSDGGGVSSGGADQRAGDGNSEAPQRLEDGGKVS